MRPQLRPAISRIVVDDLLRRASGKLTSYDSTRGTLLHGTKLSVATWERAADLVLNGDRVRVREIAATCSVSYKTAWRIRQVLTDAAQFNREARFVPGDRSSGSSSGDHR